MLPARTASALSDQGFDDQLLARIEQRIVEGEMRVTRIVTIIDQLAHSGHDPRHTEDLLHRFEEVLEVWMARRKAIMLAMPDRIEDKPDCTQS